MGSHTEVTNRETTMKGYGGWWILTIQPLLVGGGPPEASRRGREMGEGEAGQQNESEKRIHRQVLSALFIYVFERRLMAKPTAPRTDQLE